MQEVKNTNSINRCWHFVVSTILTAIETVLICRASTGRPT